MNHKFLLTTCLVVTACSPFALADVTRTEANSGNLIMEDIPVIPQSVVADLNRYQNVWGCEPDSSRRSPRRLADTDHIF